MADLRLIMRNPEDQNTAVTKGLAFNFAKHLKTKKQQQQL